MGNQCSVTRKIEGFDSQYIEDDSNCIGTGTFSEVYRCWPKTAPEKMYAVKVINTWSHDHRSLTRVHDEISILKVLGNHPSIMTLIDVYENLEQNNIRVVVELCEGGELYTRIKTKLFYQEQEGMWLLLNLMEAIAYIHSKGVMHRDLKPENVLMASVQSDTDVKISDFGLAKMSKGYPRQLPRSNSICGSDPYLAPEVIRQEEYGREIDIWACGVISYAVLCGSLPFFDNNLQQLYRKIVERELTFAEPQWEHLSDGAQDFITSLLDVQAANRLTAEDAQQHPWLHEKFARATSFTSNTSEVMQRGMYC